MNDAVSNTPELSVSELAGALKRTVEDAFAQVRIRGEISGYRGPHGSGHVYFSLKDQNARIDAVIWKGVFSRIKFRPEDGLEVIATGRISTFPGKSSYQIIIEQMEPAGVGEEAPAVGDAVVETATDVPDVLAGAVGVVAAAAEDVS